MADFVKLNGYDVKDKPSREFIESSLKIAFLSNGQQNDLSNVAVAYNDDYTFIFDLGMENACQTLRAFLTDNTNKKINAVIISHYHEDHIGQDGALGLKALVNDDSYDWSECTFYLPHNNIDYNKLMGNNETYIENNQIVVNFLNNKGIDYVYPIENQVVEFNEHLKIKFNNLLASYFEDYYNDYYDNTNTNMNNFSMISFLSHYDNVIAFTGDIYKKAQANNYKEFSNVKLLQIPHHNVDDDCNNQFAQNLNPQFAVSNLRNTLQASLKTQLALKLMNSGCIITDTHTSDTPIFESTKDEVVSISKIIPSPIYYEYNSGSVITYPYENYYNEDLDTITTQSIVRVGATTLNKPSIDYGVCITFGEWMYNGTRECWLWQYVFGTFNDSIWCRYKQNTSSAWPDWTKLSSKYSTSSTASDLVYNKSNANIARWAIRGGMCCVNFADVQLVAGSYGSDNSTIIFSGLPRPRYEINFLMYKYGTTKPIRLKLTTNGDIRIHYDTVENSSDTYYGELVYPVFIP